VGVYQRKFGGLAEFAATINVDVETDELLNTLGLLCVSVKPVNGKWSFPRGQPCAQYACQVKPAGAIRSATRFAAFRLP